MEGLGVEEKVEEGWKQKKKDRKILGSKKEVMWECKHHLSFRASLIPLSNLRL